MDASKNYQEAYEISAKAIKDFGEAKKAYRSMKIGDVQFLKAKKIYDAAMAAYDKAYAAEIA